MEHPPLALNNADLRQLRVGHRYRLHSLSASAGGSVLIASVAQDRLRPCTWGVSYTALPGDPEIRIRRLRFDSDALQRFSQTYGRSLSWLDSSFMLRLCLEHTVRGLAGENLVPNDEPQRTSLADLHILRVNGALPQLDALLEACREHVVLYWDLREVRDLPPLEIH